jgi:hypothetical protein
MKINTKKTVIALFAIAAFLLFAHVGVMVMYFAFGHSHVLGLSPMFNLDLEKNIPTFFQTFLLVGSAILLLFISILESKKKSPLIGYWIALTIGLTLMAGDEWFQLHEKLTKPIQNLIGPENLGVFYFSWVIIGIILILLVALVFRKFLVGMQYSSRHDFLLAAIIYLSGSIGFEMIGGYIVQLAGSASIIYHTSVLCEESLEMAGIILFVRGLLKYLHRNYQFIIMQFSVIDNPQVGKI